MGFGGKWINQSNAKPAQRHHGHDVRKIAAKSHQRRVFHSGKQPVQVPPGLSGIFKSHKILPREVLDPDRFLVRQGMVGGGNKPIGKGPGADQVYFKFVVRLHAGYIGLDAENVNFIAHASGRDFAQQSLIRFAGNSSFKPRTGSSWILISSETSSSE